MMEYRELGRTGLRVSTLGVGVEHLRNLSAERIAEIVSEAAREGMNYFDLVWSLLNVAEGFRQAIEGRRSKVLLALHLGSGVENGAYIRSRDPSECERQFRNLLDRLGTDYADVLNIHYVLNAKVWREVNGKGIIALAERLRNEGLAKHIGMSTHDPLVATAGAETGVIESIMLQVNVAGHGHAARNIALRRCEELDVGVVAMKPFASGKLLEKGKKVRVATYQSGWKTLMLRIPECATPARLINYVLSQKGVCTTVVGISSTEQLRKNLAYFTASPEEKDYAPLFSAL